MSSSTETGDAVELSTDVSFNWYIKNFFSFAERADDFYRSPLFTFADSFWYLIMYPNGQTRHNSVGWIDLYLEKEDDCSTKTVSITLGISDSGAKSCFKGKFFKSHNELGEIKFLSREHLRRYKDVIMPSGTMTVYCILGCYDTNASRTSLLSSLRKVALNMKSMWADENSGDFTLTCQDRSWVVHKAILGSRCPFFDELFRNSWAEESSGELKFFETDLDTLDTLLHYIYTSEVKDLSDDNVCSLYIHARTFLLVDLKRLCMKYMEENMGLNLVFKAFQIAINYKEEDLKKLLIEYLIEKSVEVFETQEWKQFADNVPSHAIRILEKSFAKKEQRNKKSKQMLNLDSNVASISDKEN